MYTCSNMIHKRCMHFCMLADEITIFHNLIQIEIVYGCLELKQMKSLMSNSKQPIRMQKQLR